MIYTIFQTAITVFTIYNLVQCIILIRATREDTQKIIDMLNQKTV